MTLAHHLLACLLAGCVGYGEEIRPVRPCEQTSIAPPAITDEPIRQHPPSISLGYIGDGMLTPSPPIAQRWPWVQERFAHDPWLSLGRRGYGRRR